MSYNKYCKELKEIVVSRILGGKESITELYEQHKSRVR